VDVNSGDVVTACMSCCTGIDVDSTVLVLPALLLLLLDLDKDGDVAVFSVDTPDAWTPLSLPLSLPLPLPVSISLAFVIAACCIVDGDDFVDVDDCGDVACDGDDERDCDSSDVRLVPHFFLTFTASVILSCFLSESVDKCDEWNQHHVFRCRYVL
jgi:hypothetical protein